MVRREINNLSRLRRSPARASESGATSSDPTAERSPWNPSASTTAGVDCARVGQGRRLHGVLHGCEI
ncbi:hypothetical protein L484_003403 [Morus notabilis]|uniref:Uncharacterized protein n=1 Tax=Morus notabilis TaxID=981085 RepID=W9SBN0_9ROSA|nr:hypothetical protein L484_003403 [Morus notabilis]